MVIEPTQTTGSLLRLMASLDLDTEDQLDWPAGIRAAAERSGGAVAVIAILAQVNRERLAALAEVARLADPCLGWSPQIGVRHELARAGYRPLDVHLPDLALAP
jgi:hypothetical protein